MQYNSVYTDKNGSVEQRYGDLDPVLEDEAEAIRIVSFMGADNFGEKDKYILNKDPKKDNITSNQIKTLFKDLTKMLMAEPDTDHALLFFYAGHGIDFNSQQNIVLN